LPKNYKAKLKVEKNCTNALVQKSFLKNVGEIDTCSQFHQHFMSSFCADIFVPKNYKAKM